MTRLRPLIWPLIIASLAAILYTTKIRREMADFAVYRVAAARALAGQPLYRAEDGHYQFKYLPAFAFAVSPLSALDPETAKALWFALSVGLLTAFLRWSIRALPERRRSERLLLWLTVLLTAKFYAHELTLGQTNILFGALLVAALLAVQIDRPLIAGALVGLAAFVKPYALLLLPWLAVSYGLTTLLVAAGVLCVGVLLPVVTYGWTGNIALLEGWFRTVTTTTTPNLLVSDNISLAAMSAKWLGPGRAAAVLAASSGAALLLLAAAIWIRRRAVVVPDYLEFAFLMLLMPLLSPQGWDYMLLLGTPATICLLDRWSELTRAWRVLAGAALGVMGLTMFDLMGRTLYARFMALSIVTVCAIAVAVSLARMRWKALA